MALVDATPRNVFHQQLPPGIEVRPCEYGFGLFATSHFHMGETLYEGEQIVIPNEFDTFDLVLNGKDEYELDTDTHSVAISASQRLLYLFDSFMNHSCEPSTVSRQSEDQARGNKYDTVALRAIQPGDQITCDYNLFEYDAHGKTIEKCQCGAAGCVGRINGFKYLSTAEQLKRLDDVEEVVLERLRDDPSAVGPKFLYVTNLDFPEGIGLHHKKHDRGYCKTLVATRPFAAGDVVYTNQSTLISADDVVVVSIGGKRMHFGLDHTVNRGNGQREYYGFDTFQNHSCAPNTIMTYLNGHSNLYEIVACTDILTGEEITCDYETFDQLCLDGLSFTCDCGAACCRNVIRY